MTQIDQEQNQNNSLRSWVELAKDRNDFLISRIEGIGSKALGVFTVAALIIGIAIPLGVTNTPDISTAWTISFAVLLGLAGINFLMTTVSFVIVYDPTLYRVGPSPKTIFDAYVDSDPREAYLNLLYWTGEWWTVNMATGRSKARWLRIAILSTSLEILFIGIWAALLLIQG